MELFDVFNGFWSEMEKKTLATREVDISHNIIAAINALDGLEDITFSCAPNDLLYRVVNLKLYYHEYSYLYIINASPKEIGEKVKEFAKYVKMEEKKRKEKMILTQTIYDKSQDLMDFAKQVLKEEKCEDIEVLIEPVSYTKFYKVKLRLGDKVEERMMDDCYESLSSSLLSMIRYFIMAIGREVSEKSNCDDMTALWEQKKKEAEIPKKKKVFISIPMRAKSLDQVKMETQTIFSKIRYAYPKIDWELINSHPEERCRVSTKETDLDCLGKRVKLLSKADLFIQNDFYDDALCTVEKKIAKTYGIPSVSLDIVSNRANSFYESSFKYIEEYCYKNSIDKNILSKVSTQYAADGEEVEFMLKLTNLLTHESEIYPIRPSDAFIIDSGKTYYMKNFQTFLQRSFDDFIEKQEL